MDEILLIQTIERYLDGSMTANEKAQFEEIRKQTPEIDQMVVEHSMFLHQMENFSQRKNFAHQLNAIHDNLLASGEVIESNTPPTTKGKVIQFFNKYKKVTAIAAAVAGGIAIMTSSVFNYYKSPASDITQLGVQLKQQQNQIAVLNKEITKSKIPTGVDIKGGGSSFLIDGKGYLVTNAHVLDDANFAIVYNENGDEYKAKVVYKNNNNDLAILKIEDDEFKPVKLPYSIKKSNADLGEEIYTIGYPNYPRTDVVYNVGYLSSLKGYNGDTLTSQIQMNANHGNSGGPIFNKRGEVIGVLSTKLSKADGVSFAIKSKNIYQVVDDLKDSDTANANLKITTTNQLNGDDRVQQVKKVSDRKSVV